MIDSHGTRRITAPALAGIAIFVILLWLWWATKGAPLVLELIDGNPVRLDMLGKLGDLFGGINALFAAFAFGGVAVAAFFQYQTMCLTERTHALQSFEPLLFHMLQLHREISRSIKIVLTDDMVMQERLASPGPHDLNSAVQILRQMISTQLVGILKADSAAEQRRRMTHAYLALYAKNEAELGPYFRSLYHVFKLIKNSNVDSKTKTRYANVARSTLSKNDLLLLAVNCVSDKGAEFVPLIEEYGLLKHISREDVDPDKYVCQGFFEPTATMSAAERRSHWNGKAPK